MAWRGCVMPLLPFPPPPLHARHIVDPPYFGSFPDWRQSFYHGGRHGGTWDSDKSITALHDKKLEQLGDLGWSLDYATAWCYRHLVGRQPEVADAIDTIRDICDVVTPDTPFEVFDHLDNALFGSKLRSMVYLRWKPHASCTTGTTSGPNIAGAPRITVELNSTAFEGFDADIDDLLEPLIHQMIHAFFLVCCGVQKPGDKQDGRLMDGVHFGVILMTIKDICKHCADGPLRLVFHAAKRKALEGQPNSLDSVWPYTWDTMRGGDSAMLQPYILTSGVGPAPADSQTHCLRDNRHVTFHEIRNWQVQVYARALDANMEAKGERIWDFNEKHKLVEHDRRFIPKPSVEYIDLIWDKRRIMAHRERALLCKSQKAAIELDAKFELAIPECEEQIFKCVYDFLNRKAYAREEGEEEIAKARYSGRRQLAPVLVGHLRLGHVQSSIDRPGILMHIKVFKIAEKMAFNELEKYALRRLYELETTDDEPIEPLRLVYLDPNGDHEAPIHTELQHWARRFLCRTDEHSLEHYPLGSSWCNNGVGISNLVKMIQLHPDGFQDLCHRSRSFEEDVRRAVDKIISGQSSESPLRGLSSSLSPLSGLTNDSLISSPLLRGRLPGGLGLGLGAPPLLTERITDIIEDRMVDDDHLLAGLGLGMARGGGLARPGLLPLGMGRQAGGMLGDDLFGGIRAPRLFDRLPAI